MIDQISIAANMAADWWSERLEAGDKTAFRETIRAGVEEALRDPGRGMIQLECDYDPRGLLLNAVHAAGIECRGMMFSARGILPEKHELTVWPDKLEPKEGYGQWLDPIPVPTTEGGDGGGE